MSCEAYSQAHPHHDPGSHGTGAVGGGAPILLLDECTSALDAETEQKVLERLRALPGRTCIAVTHRPAALGLCDVQLEVSEGHILVKKTVK